MKVINWAFIALVSFVIFSMGCQDQSLVGIELLGDESINVAYVDTFTLRAKTITNDNTELVTYRSTSGNTQTLMIGSVDDPYFGVTTSQAFMETRLLGITALPDYSEATFDSLVLILILDSLGTYGEVTSHDVEVYKLTDQIVDLDTIYGYQTFATEATPIGVRNNVIVDARDSIKIIGHASGEEEILEPQLRIKLDDAFGQLLFADTNAVKSDTAFTQFMHGINVRSVNASNSMFGVDLNANTSGAFRTSMVMYYSVDTVKFSYPYFIGGRRSSSFTQDLNGTVVGSSIGDYALGDEQVYIQSMLGTNFEVDISSVMSFSDQLINKVELELYLAELPDDDLELYYPCTDIIASSRDENGDLKVVKDIEVSLSQVALSLGGGNSTTSRRVIYGGELEEVELNGLTVQKYTMNLTAHVQYLHDNPSAAQDIIFTALSRTERPSRSIIFGPGHSEYPAKLKVTYTNP